MSKHELKNSVIIGFALFAVFFGAGNLIFPPAIGIVSGTHWVTAIAGLTLSAILLPIITVFAISNMGGETEHLCRPVAPWFSFVYLVFFVLFVGFLGVPRQGGTAIESGLFGLFPALREMKLSLFFGLVVYFSIVFYLNCNPTKIVDRVGSILTPFLLVILLYIIFMSVVRPIGVPLENGLEGTFTNAFLTGYQTGDVVVGIVVASMFVASIRDHGYTEKKSMMRMTFQAAVVAFLGLLLVYGGLLYLGATGAKHFSPDMDQTDLLISLVKMSVGSIGSNALSVAVFLACLTTTTGIVSSVANMVFRMSKGKISYKLVVALSCLVGVAVGTIGVSAIVKISFPTFFLIYPVSIVLAFLGAFKRFVPNHLAREKLP